MAMDVSQDDIDLSMEASERNAMTFSGSRWYTQQVNAVLQNLHEEFDKDALDHLRIRCQELPLDRDIKSALLTKSLNGIFAVLLEHFSNDVSRLIEILSKYAPSIVHDLKAKDQLEWLGWVARQQQRYSSRTEHIHGRKDEIARVMQFLNFGKGGSKRLVNVWGMPGIGKSFLIKHIRSELCHQGRVVFYIDTQGVKELKDLTAEILLQLNSVDLSCTQDALGTFRRFLLQFKKDPVILILDDLSFLMDKTDNSQKLLEYLHNLLYTMDQSDVKLKVLVTSRAPFTMNSETSEEKILLPIKVKMRDYTQDVPLGILPRDDCLKFFGASLQDLSLHDKQRLLAVCQGHPYALHLMSQLTRVDYTPTTEYNRTTATDVKDKINNDLFDEMFTRAFSELSEEKRRVLYCVSIFTQSAPLHALQAMLRPEASMDIKEQFKNSFWLTFQIFKKRNMVSAHHPLIKDFLRKKVEEEPAVLKELQERFIAYYLNQLTKVGEECAPEPPHKPDFVQRVCTKFLNDRVNFKQTFYLLERLDDPLLLFTCKANASGLRSVEDIAHLFLCLCQFHDWFDGCLTIMLDRLVQGQVKVINHRLLIQTLHVTLLAINKEWIDLEQWLGSNLVDPTRISSTSPDLYRFCKALHNYARGSLYAHQCRVKEVDLEALAANWKKACETALAELKRKHLGGRWKRVRSYFSICVSLVMADATVNRSFTEMSYQRAFEICYSTSVGLLQEAPILQPTVYSAMAGYKTNEANLLVKSSNFAAAHDLFLQASHYHLLVCDQFLIRRMECSIVSAKNLDNYASMMRTWGYLRAQIAKSEQTEEATAMYLKATDLGAKALLIWESVSFSSTSKEDLFTAYINQGTCFTRLSKCHHKINPDTDGNTTSRLKHSFQMKALSYYSRAYNLLKDDYRRCHLQADSWKLDKLITWLPYLMRKSNQTEERIDKVETHLALIRHEVSKGAHQQLNLSGSDVSYSSTDDDSFSDDDGNSDEKESAPLPSTSFDPDSSYPGKRARR